MVHLNTAQPNMAQSNTAQLNTRLGNPFDPPASGTFGDGFAGASGPDNVLKFPAPERDGGAAADGRPGRQPG